MSKKPLHIVSFDVPFPPDYGGVIDVFYRIEALYKLGYKITLHCFEYGRGEQKYLEEITDKVIYYKRKKTLFDWFSKTPFIVKSRGDQALLKNLLVDDGPILFEGIHTTYFLGDERLKNRTKIVRAHNVEHDYYRSLALKAKGDRKFYLNSEARKLKDYEIQLSNADHILSIQHEDFAHFKTFHPSVYVLPASMPEIKESSYSQTEKYVLFHGNLSVGENEAALIWLVDNVFPAISHDIIVAGKNPGNKLKQLCEVKKIDLRPNPSDDEMKDLITNARVQLLWTDQSTGLKLKLLYALLGSGHIIVNEKTVVGSNLSQFCSVVNYAKECSEHIDQLMQTPLSLDDYNARIHYLKEHFSTYNNCEKIFGKLIND